MDETDRFCVIRDVLAAVKIMGCTGSGYLFIQMNCAEILISASIGTRYLGCIRSLNHSERLFDRQTYLLSKSMTSDTLIIMMSADK